MALSAPRQTLVCFAWTPEHVERVIRDLLRAEVLLARFAAIRRSRDHDQEEHDACLTTMSALKLTISLLESAWESQIGLGEG